jgi:hypothetical protein
VTAALLTAISPTAPGGSAVPSSARISTVTPFSGRPTEPGTTVSGSQSHETLPASELP